MDEVPQELANIHTHQVFMMTHIVTGRVSSNNTGRFPVTSNWGNAYMALFYINNANAIWSVPIKNRSKEELLWAVTDVYAWQTARGYRPLLHKVDKETSNDIKAFIASEQVELHAPHQSHQTRGPYMEEPLHGGDRRTPTIVPSSPKQHHA
jgi:hypothetical protein